MSIHSLGSCNVLFAPESVYLGNSVKFICDEFRERKLMEEIETLRPVDGHKRSRIRLATPS
jgi:hypothetical protein